jgi:peptide-methionine (R)-S-oxide reductase
MNRQFTLLALCCACALCGCADAGTTPSETLQHAIGVALSQDSIPTIQRSEAEWKAMLSPEEYRVLRKHGTERPFTGKWLKNKKSGTYVCRGCGLELFASDTKFDSGTGWPSYYKSLRQGHIRYIEDRSFGMSRMEVRCARCDGHLGHVFDDGPPPTGRRYCINSASLDFRQGRK